jgi:hypothetical protein
MANELQGPPAVNFYGMLSGLGDTIAANRAAQAKKDAFTAATTPGPDGKIDYGRAILGLAQIDPQAAAVLAADRNHNDTIAHQTIEDKRNASNDARAASQFQQTYALQKSAADRATAAEGRAQSEFDSTPDQYAPNPNAGQPGQPQYIDQYAQAKAAAQTSVPDGFEPNPAAATNPTAPKYVPKSGGPQDPRYIGDVAAAKAAAEANVPGGGGLSLNPVYAKDADGNTVLLQTGKNGTAVQSNLPPGITLNGVDNETLAADATRLNAGDPNVLKKYSNKGQGRVDLLRLNNEANRQRVANGQDPIDITQNSITLQGDTARERTAGTMEGRMAPASIEAQGAFKIAQNSLDNLWRTNNVPVNRLLQMGETAMSNPELKAAKVATNTAVMTYSRAIAPTGVGTVDAQQHAREILDTADGPKATEAAFAQLAREVDMAHASPGIARQYFAAARKARMEGKSPPEMPTYQPAQPAANAPPPEAIAALKQDPRRAADFDAYYGAGAARAALTGGR